MEFREYLERLERIDVLRRDLLKIDKPYREYVTPMIDGLRRLEELYDTLLIESGSYPTF